ncbi:MAG TPA: hypothetical protein VK092_05020, partial [Deinococcales bacterium]|nr:hypothetical protein [Deinococcales bacterium]
MASYRPQAATGYLRRNRLLHMLPDQAGYTVWLEAPYGYGKTILTSQWADALEQEGWRVIWTVLGGREPAGLIARELGLPASVPSGVLLDELWRQPTLLVIEDLETIPEHEVLAPLLKNVHGLVLIASRGPVSCSELPRLLTRNRLVHLTAETLSFTRSEAEQLFGDSDRAADVWERTNGWPLPLHFALLTDGLPERTSLLEGMRASLGAAAWEEALLLSTVSQLRHDAALPATRELAQAGFVQHMESGYRLHPLIGDSLLQAHREAAASVLLREAARLSVGEQAAAFERTGLHAELTAVLEDISEQLWRREPEGVLRWDALLGSPVSARRHLAAGGALKVLGRHRESATRLEAALAPGTLSADHRLAALAELCWVQVLSDPESANATVQQGEALLSTVTPERAGRFLANA